MRNLEMLDDRYVRTPNTRNLRQARDTAALDVHPCGLIMFAQERNGLMAHMRQWRNHDALHCLPNVVNCFYVNPVMESFWLLEQSIVTADTSGVAEAGQLLAMLQNAMRFDALSFTTVLVDKFCAARSLLLQLEELEKAYWCRVRDDWAVVGDVKRAPRQEAQTLAFNRHTLTHGKLVVPVGFPSDNEVRLFKVGASSCATTYVATNQLEQDDVEAAQLMCELLETGRNPVRSYR